MSEPTPDQLTEAVKLVVEIREEIAAQEALRVFAVHGDSSNFDQDDARAIARLLAEEQGERRRLQAEVDRLEGTAFLHQGCEGIRRRDVEHLIGQRDQLRDASRAFLGAVAEMFAGLGYTDLLTGTNRLGDAYRTLERLLAGMEGPAVNEPQDRPQRSPAGPVAVLGFDTHVRFEASHMAAGPRRPVRGAVPEQGPGRVFPREGPPRPAHGHLRVVCPVRDLLGVAGHPPTDQGGPPVTTLTPEQQTMPRSYVVGDRSLIINFPDGRRILPHGLCVCSVCDKVVRTAEHGRIRSGTYQVVARVHGPKADRCPGSGRPFKGFVEASRLPGWADMGDFDKGQALGFVHKCWWEQDYQYARDNYPPEYTGPGLADLISTYQCRHATAVVGSLGKRLEDVENFWAKHAVRTPFGPRVPSRIQEPLTQMARRVLGEAEYDRLIGLWSGA